MEVCSYITIVKNRQDDDTKGCAFLQKVHIFIKISKFYISLKREDSNFGSEEEKKMFFVESNIAKLMPLASIYYFAKYNINKWKVDTLAYLFSVESASINCSSK